MAGEIIRVFIIDRNVAWRQAIDELLIHQPDMEVLGVSSDLSSAFHQLHKLQPDVVLIDSLPSSENERAIFGQLKRSSPNVCFVLHTGMRQEAVIANLVEAGVTEGVPKGSSPRKIVQAVREACLGHLERPEAMYNPAE